MDDEDWDLYPIDFKKYRLFKLNFQTLNPGQFLRVIIIMISFEVLIAILYYYSTKKILFAS